MKKLRSTEWGALFRHFASPRWSPLRMRTKVVSFFIFFQELSNKKKLRLHDKRWLKYSQGWVLPYGNKMECMNVWTGFCLNWSPKDNLALSVRQMNLHAYLHLHHGLTHSPWLWDLYGGPFDLCRWNFLLLLYLVSWWSLWILLRKQFCSKWRKVWICLQLVHYTYSSDCISL